MLPPVSGAVTVVGKVVGNDWNDWEDVGLGPTPSVTLGEVTLPLVVPIAGPPEPLGPTVACESDEDPVSGPVELPLDCASTLLFFFFVPPTAPPTTAARITMKATTMTRIPFVVRKNGVFSGSGAGLDEGGGLE